MPKQPCPSLVEQFDRLVAKAHILLQMAGVPYEMNYRGFLKTPKGKLPYIPDGQTVVADSAFSRSGRPLGCDPADSVDDI